MNNKLVLPMLQQQICSRAKLFLSSSALVSSIILLLVATGVTSAYAAGSVILEDISYASLPGNRVKITLTASGPLDEPTSFTTDNPARIALDFIGMKSGLERKTTPISIGMARSITAIEAGARTRVVVNLVDAVAYTVNIEGNRAIISIENGMVPAASSSTGQAASMSDVAHKTVSGRAIENIDFRRGLAGEGRIMITLSDPATLVDMREEGGRIVLDFFDTSLPEVLMRNYDVTDFATPVQTIEVSPSDGNVHIEISPIGNYEHLAYQTDRLYTIEVRPLTKEEKEKLEKVKRIFTGDRLSFNFQEIEVRSVLQLLADFTGLNMVTSDTVTGNVTLRLKNVPWDQALDIILKTKGLSMRQTDNVILVAPTEEIAAREKLELESERQVEELAPLRSEFIQINYAKAADLATLLKTEGNNLLSERGSITTDNRTNTLLIQDTAKKLEDISRLIQTLDIPVRQVLIESRIVIANDDFAKDIGVRFGLNTTQQVARVGGQEAELFIGGGVEGHMGGTLGFSPGGFENPGGSTMEALMVNLPATAPSGAINLFLGRLGSYLLQLELSAMQTEGRGEIVSSPRVITSDQKKATIKQGVEIPYQQASSSGATTISFKEAVLQLDVTPHITPDDRIIMDLIVNKDNPDFSRAVLGVPPVDTRSVETTVLVENGETVVLGGVFERTKIVNKERVPFFGDLPYVGFMFKQELVRDSNNELLIFVTPKILRDSMSLR